jgi:serine/threonine protein kinase
MLYQAPESERLEEMNTSCDIYSFGVFLWNMFHRITLSHYTNHDLRAGVNFPVNDSLSFLSIGLEPLFRRCTAADPAQRPSMSEVTSELFRLSSEYRLKEGWNAPPEIFYEEPSNRFIQRNWYMGTRTVRY